MVVLRDEIRIARLKKASAWFGFLGMGALLVGLFVSFTVDEFSPLILVGQLLGLAVGWIFAQISVYLAHRYVRSPRPDEALEEAIEKVARNGRFYNYILPAPHVLLLPTGIIIFIAKYQGGTIIANGDEWKQEGQGMTMRKLFGQESLGNPSKEAESQVSAIANYLRKHAPEVEEVRIAPLIVFTSKNTVELDVKNANIPAMYVGKLRGFLKDNMQKGANNPMPEADYKAIQAAFDRRAGDLIDEDE